jgi:putative redox protein
MASIHASIARDHYAVSLASPSGNTYLADEPPTSGGGDKGFDPSELLCASLATCTCVTLRMYADRKGWPLEGLTATVNFTRDAEANRSSLTRSITLQGPLLTPEMNERLLQIANSCHIHRTLSNPIDITTTLAHPASVA